MPNDKKAKDTKDKKQLTKEERRERRRKRQEKQAKKPIIEVTEKVRVDPATFEGLEGYQQEQPYIEAKLIKDRNDIEAAPEGIAVGKNVRVAQCPHCGFHLMYVLDKNDGKKKVIPLNTFTAKNRKRAGMWEEECDHFDKHRGVLCPKCRKSWRVPKPAPKGGNQS